jgi:protein O-mannosyl-transferase
MSLENSVFISKSGMVSFSMRRRRIVLVCLLLGVVTLALYWPVRHYDFVQYDDDDYVFDNPAVRMGLSWGGVVWSFISAHSANWHPLTWLSHMLDCQLFGLNAGSHHLTNALLHSVNAALLFLLLRSMTGAFWRSAFVTALFAWHPLRVESVAWISERKDVLSGFFFMLTLLAYVQYAKLQNRILAVADVNAPPSAPSRKSVSASFYYRLSLIFFLLGLLSKPMLVTVPFVLILIDFWPLNRLQPFARSASDERPLNFLTAREGRGLLMEKVPFFLLSIIFGLITIYAQKSGGSVVSVESEGVLPRIENALIAYPAYIQKLFWPHDLAFLYLRPATVSIASLILAVLILSGISFVAGANLRSRPYLAVGWLWFLGMLLPVSGLIQSGLQSIADRYTYLPSIGLFLMLTWGAAELTPVLFARRTAQCLTAAAATLVLLACMCLTRQQLAYWKNTETLMEHALQIDPNNYIAHSDLGLYLFKQGRIAEARVHHQRARELDPALKGNTGDSNTGADEQKTRPTPEKSPHGGPGVQ